MREQSQAWELDLPPLLPGRSVAYDPASRATLANWIRFIAFEAALLALAAAVAALVISPLGYLSPCLGILLGLWELVRAPFRCETDPILPHNDVGFDERGGGSDRLTDLGWNAEEEWGGERHPKESR